MLSALRYNSCTVVQRKPNEVLCCCCQVNNNGAFLSTLRQYVTAQQAFSPQVYVVLSLIV
ncbi:hypothetical protein B9P84_06425 [Citrobacter braakii]|uniref:Uncharacterized protein n=1 Tax=Citrobacter braakii TaxID=57706 RepID=A0A1V8NUP4_CITBR|nr:hypothetical protein BZK42_21160 [Citrobacter braakii]OXU12661.1 hypothetical protein B9P84_06425 [Citrobacter braakii]PAX79701.1 hypothetical protein CIK43_11390 [Citrobacter sp. TSA-1]